VSIGTHTVTVTPVGGGAAVDLSCLVDQVSTRHGRDDTDNQPEASSATVDLATDPELGPVPPELEIGATLTVATTVATTTTTRFSGRITDLTYAWDDYGPETPDRPVAQVLAASNLADVGRRVVGDVPWPQELDGARVGRIMSAAGMPINPANLDPGTVQILARDVDAQAALELARDVADSAGGVLWETRDGQVRYADAEHRRNIPIAIVLDACDVLVTPSWRRTTQGLVNKVSIGYGLPDAEGGDQPRYVEDAPDSIARYGTYDVSVSTQLAAQADAFAMGSLLLTRNSSPVWLMTDLPVDMKGLDDTQTAAILGLDVHSLVNLTGLPAIGTAPTSAVLWVEGIAETLTRGEHSILLAVSGYCRTVPPPRWDDLPTSATWDTTDPTLVWDQAACLPPQPSQGRWNDVSSTLRWDQVPATTTWDTWKG
jgi:hypothetical protein